MTSTVPKVSAAHQPDTGHDRPDVQRIESRALLIGFVIDAIMGIAGWYMFIQTDIDALFLDGNFSLISASGCLVAIAISRYSEKTTKAFPNGMHFLEPLYASIKGLLSLGLIVIAGLSAASKLYDFLFLGRGTMLQMGGILYYAVLMAVLCFTLAGVYHYFNKKIGGQSTILTVESKASLIDGVISFGLGLAILLVALLPQEGNTIFVYYTADAVITIILIVLTINTPIEAFKESFIEMMNGVIRKGQIKHDIEGIIASSNGAYANLSIKSINIHKIGKRLTIFIGIEFIDTSQQVHDLLRFKDELVSNISTRFNNTNVNLVLA